MPFSATVRKQIYNNAGGTCEKCGTSLADKEWEAHHKNHSSSGGSDTASNGRALCKPCHSTMYGPGH